MKQNLFALKEVIDPNKRDRERFIFEGGILKRPDHRALPHVYRVFEHDKLKRVYLLMDYIKGRNRDTPASASSIVTSTVTSMRVMIETNVVNELQNKQTQ